MRLSALKEVYVLREENSDIISSGLNGYFISWLSMALYPVIFVSSLINKYYLKIGLVSFGYILLFMMTGLKTIIFMPFILIGFNQLYNWQKKYRIKFYHLIISAITALSLILLPIKSSLAFFFKSLLFTRTIAISGKQFAIYLSFFENNPVTNYTHISIIKRITGDYPYGNERLGYVVTNGMANANATFWVTDGIAAMMIPGLIVISIIFLIYLFFINHLNKKFDSKFLFLLFLPSSTAILNASFFTYLVSNGVILIILILLFIKFPYNLSNRA